MAIKCALVNKFFINAEPIGVAIGRAYFKYQATRLCSGQLGMGDKLCFNKAQVFICDLDITP